MRYFLPPLLLLSVAAIPGQSPAQAVATPAAENYAVYSASLPFGYHTQGLSVAIRSRTIAVPDLAAASNSVQQEFESMKSDPEVAAAIRQMQTARPSQALAPMFHLNGAAPADKVELLNSDELDGQLHLNEGLLGRKAGWRNFNQQHREADGLTELSAVGYNPAHTVAVFYAIHRSGTGCSDEGFEVLRKSKGRWRRVTDKGFTFADCN
jgi:hypothetical protein